MVGLVGAKGYRVLVGAEVYRLDPTPCLSE